MSDVILFQAEDWFWHVRETDKIWSSKKTAYVEDYDAQRLTHILNEQELDNVLRQLGLDGPLS